MAVSAGTPVPVPPLTVRNTVSRGGRLLFESGTVSNSALSVHRLLCTLVLELCKTRAVHNRVAKHPKSTPVAPLPCTTRLEMLTV